MTNEGCTFESDVRRAARQERWSDELRRHVGSCEECAATAAVGPWLAGFAALPDRQHILPAASIIWLKAQILQNQQSAERVSRPLGMLQSAAYLVVAGCWAALLNWKWSALQQWFTGLTPSRFVSAATTSGGASISLTLMLMLLALASLTVMVAMHTILAEE
jgi:hypothetical protein